jgi:hypothetical protein
VSALIDEDKKVDKLQVIKRLAIALEDADWDCQHDSKYFNHPLIKPIFQKLGHVYGEDEE